MSLSAVMKRLFSKRCESLEARIRSISAEADTAIAVSEKSIIKTDKKMDRRHPGRPFSTVSPLAAMPRRRHSDSI